MRVRSQWTPGGIGLWLIAAILATLVVCSQLEPQTPSPEPDSGVFIEFELDAPE